MEDTIEDEVKKSLARKRRRRREKAAAGEKPSQNQSAAEKMDLDEDVPEVDEKAEDISSAEITDLFVPYVIVRTGGKVRSFDWVRTKSSKPIEFLISATNNQLEVFKVPTKDKSKKTKSDELPDYSRSGLVEMPGHRADIRALALSSDDRMLASASNGGLKVWNVRTRSNIRNFECGYALCCAFLPGDKIVVVGTKSGDLELFDVASAAMIGYCEGP